MTPRPPDRAAGLAPVARKTALPASAVPRGAAGMPPPGTVPGGGTSSPGLSGGLRPGQGQQAIAAAMSEDRGRGSLDYHVREIIAELGLWGFHPLISIGSRKGWPDWTVIGKWIMYRELKSETGTLKPDQRKVRDLILTAGGDWDLWRPSDYLSGRVARELAALAGLRGAS